MMPMLSSKSIYCQLLTDPSGVRRIYRDTVGKSSKISITGGAPFVVIGDRVQRRGVSSKPIGSQTFTGPKRIGEFSVVPLVLSTTINRVFYSRPTIWFDALESPSSAPGSKMG
jgi:hypothetical protein